MPSRSRSWTPSWTPACKILLYAAVQKQPQIALALSNSTCSDPSRQVPPPPQTWREGPPASIAATEQRGITIAQLDTIVDAINKHADAKGFLPGWIDRNGKTCHKATIGLYPRVVRFRLKSREMERTNSGEEIPGYRSTHPEPSKEMFYRYKRK